MYPADWTGRELALLGLQNTDRRITKDPKAESRAIVVHDELSLALMDNLILIQVDLSQLQPNGPLDDDYDLSEEVKRSEPLDSIKRRELLDSIKRSELLDSIIRSANGRLGYYSVLGRHWTIAAAADHVDWARSRITLSKDHLVLRKRDSTGYVIDYSVLPDADFTVDAYISRPEEVLAKLIDNINNTAKNMADYLAISKSRWGEVSAVIWRILAIDRPKRQFGSAKAIAARVAEYFDTHGVPSDVPSTNHLKEAIRQTFLQYEEEDTHSPVLPSFSGHHKQD